ncbi:hypothetical protein KCH_46850 [Kitasatospora cheerisanensis KCTC 2395]|uniref:Uncharacterized protein n=1 Tax=Kitasatospora cheerisanensis KCTC 2395 TaxID=1348663 RepID=A0A066YNX1_9ACTN|nr:hypothetical protein KCH_46850 [Kitasatospora cheerisanensis KCTC 2395]
MGCVRGRGAHEGDSCPGGSVRHWGAARACRRPLHHPPVDDLGIRRSVERLPPRPEAYGRRRPLLLRYDPDPERGDGREPAAGWLK